MELPRIINKLIFQKYLANKFSRVIAAKHIISIFYITLEEIKKDLMDFKEIVIHNFGSFKLKVRKPSRYFDMIHHEFRMTKSRNYLNIKLDKDFADKFKSFVDKDQVAREKTKK